MSRQPYDFGQALEATNNAKAAQKVAEENLKAAWRDFGAKRKAYQLALAKKVVELKAAGQPSTYLLELARGDDEVAKLRYAKDIAEGVKEAAASALWRHSGDRHDLREFIQWSKAVDIRVHLHDDPESEPGEPEIIGGRRAA